VLAARAVAVACGRGSSLWLLHLDAARDDAAAFVVHPLRASFATEASPRGTGVLNHAAREVEVPLGGVELIGRSLRKPPELPVRKI
jgi:hypothetical protein